jgi:hypothetical protein
MGFRPACEVAEALTDSISDVIPTELITQAFKATCVDNVLFCSSKQLLPSLGQSFIDRSRAVGAIIKDPEITIIEEYDFCGEHYDHQKKTRRLTTKTRDKAVYVVSVLRNKTVMTSRQWLAIFGLLQYAGGTLAIHIAKYHHAMRFMASLASRQLDAKVSAPPHVYETLLPWASIAATNDAVPVHTPDRTAQLTIYTDASASGWGAWAVNAEGSIRTLSARWTSKERAQWDLNSSVAAEPLAIRNAVACLVSARCHEHAAIYTDHLPLVFAAAKTVGKTLAYSEALAFLDTYAPHTTFSIAFVEGIINPADTLSRNFAPLLQVTSIGPPQHGGAQGGYWG